MDDFEAIVLHRLGDIAGTGELAVREDIAVNEAALGSLVVIRVGDVVVEHQAADLQFAVEELEEVVVVLHTNVLDNADGGDSIEALFGDIAVVHEADFRQVLEAFLLNLALAPLGLFLGQGDADGLHAAARRVAHHTAPAAAHIQVAVALFEAEFVKDEAVLIFLRFL